jgi:hypothetical protein
MEAGWERGVCFGRKIDFRKAKAAPCNLVPVMYVSS